MGLFSKIVHGLKKTKESISTKLNSIFHGELDDEFYDDLEFALVSSDIGAKASQELIEYIKQRAKKDKIKSADKAREYLRDAMIEMLDIDNVSEKAPCLITFIGVNGVGKTTTIGKFAHNRVSQKQSVLMVAADTFRAAATEQLQTWADRSKSRIVKYAQGADPSAVVYDGIASALAKKESFVLVDTAGRLHNKVNLMEELKKMSKIIDREWVAKGNQYLNYLVIDATVGQNALSQVEAFNEICPIDGIILTKIDGTSKGGIILAIAKEFGIPIKYIGVGEGIDDLQPFDAKTFVQEII